MKISQVHNLNPINWGVIGQPAKFIVFLQIIFIFLMLLLSDTHVLSILGQPCSWGSTFLTILIPTCISTPGFCLKLHTVPLQPSKSMFYICSIWPVLGVMHYKYCGLRKNITFFQVTSKVTHYFVIYKKIFELLFSHLLTDSALCKNDRSRLNVNVH